MEKNRSQLEVNNFIGKVSRSSQVHLLELPEKARTEGGVGPTTVPKDKASSRKDERGKRDCASGHPDLGHKNNQLYMSKGKEGKKAGTPDSWWTDKKTKKDTVPIVPVMVPNESVSLTSRGNVPGVGLNHLKYRRG